MKESPYLPLCTPSTIWDSLELVPKVFSAFYDWTSHTPNSSHDSSHAGRRPLSWAVLRIWTTIENSFLKRLLKVVCYPEMDQKVCLVVRGNGRTRQSSLLHAIVLFFGLDLARNTIVVYSVLRN